MKKIKVLVTAIGAPGGADIIELLREDPRIYILGMDVDKDIASKYLVDKFIVNLPGKNNKFSEYLLNIALKEKIDVIFPLSTDELLSLSRNIKLFERFHIPICISDFRTISIANNKAKLYEYFKGEDFIPKYEIPNSIRDLEEKIYRLGFPNKDVCVKPFISHGSRGFRVITNDVKKYGYSQFQKPYNFYISFDVFMNSIKKNGLPNVILVEYLPGEEWGIDIFIDPIDKNKIITTRNNGLVRASSIKVAKLEKNDLLINIAEKILDKLDFKYILNIDVKFTLDGRPKIIEINPRVPATVKLVSKAGNNLPLLSIKRAIGEKCRINPVEYGKRIYFYKKSIVRI